MEKKYTSAPWCYSPDVIGTSFYIQTAYDTDKSFIGETGGGQQSISEIEANAKLIAAAPELLEVLQEITEYDVNSIYFEGLIEKAIKVINKATL